ncbi:MAG: 6-phosphogluconolactonase [Bacteroidales bacterium]|nr:6-phosphogluconolactonase [Bacteroidales bacterium]
MMKHFKLPKDGGLAVKGLPEDILHSCDRIPTDVFEEESDACSEICRIVKEDINSFSEPRKFRLGFSTGSTPAPLYEKLVKEFNEGGISFRNVAIFSTDEYYFGDKCAPESRNGMLRQFIAKVDVDPADVHILPSSMPREEVTSECARFDEAARDMDLLITGMGEEGQVAFNEAGSAGRCRTRTVLLSYKSRKRQAFNFGGNVFDTPKMAVTMGIETMMTARKVIIMAWGEDKADIVQKIVEEKYDPSRPISFFQRHKNVRLLVDEGAGSLLVREAAPWLLGPCDWTPKLRRKAVIWLSQKVGKPVLELSHQDYLENSLDELLELYGPYDQINIDVFNDLQHTITGWPGGKPNADDSTRPVASKPFPKKVLIFSPHPDDDVISMGGTFIRLTHQGHDVHVAYETSGNVAVHDDVVLQHMDAARKMGFGDRFDEFKYIISTKRPGEPEPRELLDIKAAIRRSEACAADRSFGLNDETNVHFLNLPFYESGGIKKLPCTQADIDIVKALMEEIKPDQIYMAGDLADPHGTHRVCTEAVLEGIEQLREEGAAWVEDCTCWLYRGAWMEWELSKVDMAVPISPAEVIEKRHAIFHHLSQKDIVPFPGEDPREFWQRAEDRTQNTARLYRSLGMAEYQAMEVFVKLN